MPGDSETYRCIVCDVLCSGRRAYDQHIRGAGHRKRSRGELGTQYFCHVCNVPLSGEKSRLEHANGAMHKNKMNALADAKGAAPYAPQEQPYHQLLQNVSHHSNTVVEASPFMDDAVGLLEQQQSSRRTSSPTQPSPHVSAVPSYGGVVELPRTHSQPLHYPPPHAVAASPHPHHPIARAAVVSGGPESAIIHHPSSSMGRWMVGDPMPTPIATTAATTTTPTKEPLLILRQLQRLQNDILQGALGNPETLELDFQYSFLENSLEVASMKIVRTRAPSH